MISLSPPHFHLSTDSICHEEAGHQSSRSGRLCGGKQYACTSPLLCEEECRIFSSPPTCEWATSALGEETCLRVLRLALVDTCQLFGSQEVQPHFLFCSKGDPHNQPSILEDILWRLVIFQLLQSSWRFQDYLLNILGPSGCPRGEELWEAWTTYFSLKCVLSYVSQAHWNNFSSKRLHYDLRTKSLVLLQSMSLVLLQWIIKQEFSPSSMKFQFKSKNKSSVQRST